MLRRGVLRLARCGHEARGRRHVHDRAAALLREHLAQLVLHAPEHAGEIDGDRPLPIVDACDRRTAWDRARCPRCCTPNRGRRSAPPRTRPSRRPKRRRTRRRAPRRRRSRDATAVAASPLMSATTTCAPCAASELRRGLTDPTAAAGDQSNRHDIGSSFAEIRASSARRDPNRLPAIDTCRARARRRSSRRRARNTRAEGPAPRSRLRSQPRATGASALTAMPVPRSSVAIDTVSRSSAALLGAYVDDRACCGESSWSVSTIALVRFRIQPDTPITHPRNDRLRQQVRRDDVDLVRDAQAPLRRLVEREVEARGGVVHEDVDRAELGFGRGDDRGAVAVRVRQIGDDRKRRSAGARRCRRRPRAATPRDDRPSPVRGCGQRSQPARPRPRSAGQSRRRCRVTHP